MAEATLRFKGDAKGLRDDLKKTFDEASKYARETMSSALQDAFLKGGSFRDIRRTLESNLKPILDEASKSRTAYLQETGNIEDRYGRALRGAATEGTRTQLKRDQERELEIVKQKYEAELKAYEILENMVNSLYGVGQDLLKDKKEAQSFVGRVKSGKGATEDEKFIAKFVEAELGREKKEGQKGALGFWGTAGAVAVGDIAADVIKNAIGKVGGLLTESTTSEKAAQAAIQAGGGLGAAAASGIPIVGPFLAKLISTATDTWSAEREVHRQAREKELIMSYGYRGVTGGRHDPGDILQRFGISVADTYPIATTMARAYGTSKNITGKVEEYLGLTRGYGLDQSLVTRLAETARHEGGAYGGTMAMQTAEIVKQTMQKVDPTLGTGDRTELSRFIQINNSLMEMIAKNTGSTSAYTTSAMMASFAGGKGFFDVRNPMFTGTLEGMQSALMNPKNEFQQARRFATLANLKPGASYWDILGAQEKGMGEPGYLSAVVKNLESSFGKNDYFKLALKNEFGWNIGQTDQFLEMWNKDKSRFQNMSEEDVRKELDKNKTTSIDIASKYTTEEQKETVKFQNEAALGAIEAIKNNMDNILKIFKANQDKVWSVRYTK